MVNRIGGVDEPVRNQKMSTAPSSSINVLFNKSFNVNCNAILIQMDPKMRRDLEFSVLYATVCPSS